MSNSSRDTEDDVWDTDTEKEAAERRIGERSLRRLEGTFVTAGYSDGVEASKYENMQTGFDQALDYALPHGRHAGRLLGRLVAYREIHGRSATGAHSDSDSALIAAVDSAIARLRALESRSVLMGSKSCASDSCSCSSGGGGGGGGAGTLSQTYVAVVQEAEALVSRLAVGGDK
ncbi:hypothetical protein H4217_003491 [Coemansia sp. RSA 1939]|nr:hypothetical protein H4217_003491 [Coemansia sp. RSA 1939]KAJ2612435.1 hypothetical protein EV177_003003 [Coemansia sp. RSA 1804]